MAGGLEILPKISGKILSAVGGGGASPFFYNWHAKELSQLWLSRGLPLEQQVHMCMSRAAQVFLRLHLGTRVGGRARLDPACG